MNKHLIIILLLISFKTNAQNLVNNGNFEIYSLCPDQKAQLDRAVGWHGIWGAGSGSCEYYNTCSSNWQLSPPITWGGGFQYPRSGNGYIGYGFYAHNSNHVEEFSANDLYDKLTNEEIYKIQFFISAGNTRIFHKLGQEKNINLKKIIDLLASKWLHKTTANTVNY